MKKLNYLLAAAAIVFGAASCEKTDENVPLSYEGDIVLEFPADGGTRIINVKSTAEIKVQSTKSWAVVTNEGNDITIQVKSTTSESVRTADVTISNGEDTPIMLQIKQAAGTFVFAPEAEYALPLKGGSIEIPYETAFENFTFEVGTATWIKVEKKESVIAISANASTSVREGIITYLAGQNSGEIKIRQYDAVEISVEASIQDYNASFTKKNTVFYTIKGKGVTAGSYAIVSASMFEGKNEAEWLSSLKDPEGPGSVFDKDDLDDINSVEGYFNGEKGKNDGAKYYVLVYATNGGDEKLVYDDVTTEMESDPLLHVYTMDDLDNGLLDFFPTKESMFGTYEFYPEGAYRNTTGKFTGFGKKDRNYGTVTISDGGQKTSSSGSTYNLVKISGFYTPFNSNIKLAGGTEWVEEDREWEAKEIENYGWVIYPSFDVLVNKGTETNPDYKFLEMIATNDGYLRMPDYYPLVGCVTKDGLIAFVDTGSLDEDFLGYNAWYLCGISMAGGQISGITGQYLAYYNWIFKTPGSVKSAVSAKYGVSLNQFRNLSRVRKESCVKTPAASRAELKEAFRIK